MKDRVNGIDDIVFRRFQPADIEAVKKLHITALKATNAYIEVDNYYLDIDLNGIQNVYLDAGGEFLVGTLNGEVVAMGAIRKISETTAEIKRMRVKTELQGLGIGKHLLSLLENAARDRGFKVIELDTTLNQIVSRKLYENKGYIEIGRGIKGGPIETIFYRKEL